MHHIINGFKNILCRWFRENGGDGYFSLGMWGKQDQNKNKKAMCFFIQSFSCVILVFSCFEISHSVHACILRQEIREVAKGEMGELGSDYSGNYKLETTSCY